MLQDIYGLLNYVNVTGDLAADLLSNIAAEQRAKVVYEYLHGQINEKFVRETIDFLLNQKKRIILYSGKPLTKSRGLDQPKILV